MPFPPQLGRPTGSDLTLRFRSCACSRGHSGPGFARAFRRPCSSFTISFRIRIYVEHACKPRRIRTSKTRDLKWLC
jgi:hypothetical protein